MKLTIFVYNQAARQGHEAIVDVLVQAGAALGVTDKLFVDSIFKDAAQAGNQHSLNIWLKAGWASDMQDTI